MKKLSLFVLCTLLSCPGLIFSMRRAGAALRTIRLIRPAKLVGAIRCASGLSRDQKVLKFMQNQPFEKVQEIQNIESDLEDLLKKESIIEHLTNMSDECFNKLWTPKNQKLLIKMKILHEQTRQQIKEVKIVVGKIKQHNPETVSQTRSLNRFKHGEKEQRAIDFWLHQPDSH